MCNKGICPVTKISLGLYETHNWGMYGIWKSLLKTIWNRNKYAFGAANILLMAKTKLTYSFLNEGVLCRRVFRMPVHVIHKRLTTTVRFSCAGNGVNLTPMFSREWGFEFDPNVYLPSFSLRHQRKLTLPTCALAPTTSMSPKCCAIGQKCASQVCKSLSVRT